MREREGCQAEQAVGGLSNIPVVDAESLTPGEGRTALPGLNQFLN